MLLMVFVQNTNVLLFPSFCRLTLQKKAVWTFFLQKILSTSHQMLIKV